MSDGATSDGAVIGGADAGTTTDQDLPPDDPAPQRQRTRTRVLIVSCVLVALAAGLVLPPLINISRYQRRITELISRSLGRPVHLSSVELRLLPMPGFVLHDLSVSENPAFGAEPVLSARTVVATVAIWPLWQGKLQISRISVDEASLNLVRSDQGRWNLESLMMGPAQPALTGADRPAQGKPMPFPYLEATNSRVNLKKGLEKTPYSLTNTDLSLWQEQLGEWRVRLRGSPLRTDLSLSREADGGTGQLRLEASLHSAAQLRDMPLRLQAEWRDAQLGQLSRLLLGSDAGWRGDLTADVQIDGTAESAQTKARLRATGVRREEFAPETPLDFDANCSFIYQHSHTAFRKVSCDTAIGGGRLHLGGDFPGSPAAESEANASKAMLEVKDLPVQAGLDLMRTLRNGFAPGIEARGRLNGSLTYVGVPLPVPAAGRLVRPVKTAHSSPNHRGAGSALAASAASKLQGSLIADGMQLRGGGLRDPLTLPKMTWTPAILSAITGGGTRTGIESRVVIPIGPASGKAEPAGQNASSASSPAAGKPDNATATPSETQPNSANAAQTVTVWLGLMRGGYHASFTGSATPAVLRNLAYALGLPSEDAADGFAGGTADFDLALSGPWVAAEPLPSSLAPAPVVDDGASDTVTGSLQLHRTHWQAPYLARPVDLPQANVLLSSKGVDLGSEFSYGALKGSLTISSPFVCRPPECVPEIQLRFAALDAAALQTGLQGAPEQKSLLSPLMDRMPRMLSKDVPALPTVALDVTADTLLLGPVTLRKPLARLECEGGKIEIQSLDAALLGGTVHLTGSFQRPASSGSAPQYSLEGALTHASPAEVGALLGGSWSGGAVNLTGKVELSGVASQELAASAKGSVQFDWQHGAVSGATPQLTHFEYWKGTASIANNGAHLEANELVSGGRRGAAEGSLQFATPAKFVFAVPTSAHPAAGPHPAAK